MFANKFSKITHYQNLLSTFNLYPNPLTVINDFGFDGLISIFSLIRRICASREFPYIARLSMRTSIDEYGNPHTTVDEDMRSRLEAKLIEQVLNFKVA